MERIARAFGNPWAEVGIDVAAPAGGIANDITQTREDARSARPVKRKTLRRPLPLIGSVGRISPTRASA
jgi:hypothetical protein